MLNTLLIGVVVVLIVVDLFAMQTILLAWRAPTQS
jgi:hypothetical protein